MTLGLLVAKNKKMLAIIQKHTCENAFDLEKLAQTRDVGTSNGQS